jgi:hypothetical protein
MFDWGDSGWEFGVFFILARYVWLDFGGLGRILAFGATSARVRGSVRYSVRKIETFQGQDR